MKADHRNEYRQTKKDKRRRRRRRRERESERKKERERERDCVNITNKSSKAEKERKEKRQWSVFTYEIIQSRGLSLWHKSFERRSFLLSFQWHYYMQRHQLKNVHYRCLHRCCCYFEKEWLCYYLCRLKEVFRVLIYYQGKGEVPPTS